MKVRSRSTLCLAACCVFAAGLDAAELVQGRSAGVPAPAMRGVSIAREADRMAAVESVRPATVAAQAGLPPRRQRWVRRHPKPFGALDEWACPAIGGIGAVVGAGIGAALSR